MTGPATAALELRDVAKSFGAVRALRSAASWSTAGSIHALVGENGAGKSTLVKIVAGVHQPRRRRPSGSAARSVDFGSTAERRPPGSPSSTRSPRSSRTSRSPRTSSWAASRWAAARRIDRAAMDARGRRAVRAARRAIDPRPSGRAACPSPTSRSSRSPRRSRSTPRPGDGRADRGALSGVEVERLFAVARSLRDEGRGAALHLAPFRRGVRPVRPGHRDARRRGTSPPTPIAEHHRRRRSSRGWSAARSATCSPRRTAEVGDVVLEVDGLSRAGVFRDISFRCAPARSSPWPAWWAPAAARWPGPSSASTSTTPARSRRRPAGRAPPHPRGGHRRRIALVPEDRRKQGLVMDLSVARNVDAHDPRRLTTPGC